MIAPSKNLETVLVKAPHRRELYTEDELIEFAKCADPVTGPLYFMDNFFFIQHPTRGKMLYHPFDYQKRLIATYHDYRYSISLMPRQTLHTTTGILRPTLTYQFVEALVILNICNRDM